MLISYRKYRSSVHSYESSVVHPVGKMAVAEYRLYKHSLKVKSITFGRHLLQNVAMRRIMHTSSQLPSSRESRKQLHYKEQFQ